MGDVDEPLTFRAVRAAGLDAGLDVVGACSAAPFLDARDVIEERKAAGLNGTMQFTYRNPTRATDPSVTLPGAQTLVVAACSYHRDPPDRPAGGPVGAVARYVWADDQARLIAGLEAMADVLRGTGHRAVVITDQNNLVDRAAAHRGGLGWFGKNANLLVPGRGSWFVLGSVLTDAGPDDLPDLPAAEVVADGCGPCERCIDACPTGAIVAPGVVDARRCLSWTLQSTGSFPRDQRVALGARIYGCDDCQEVCPPNRRELLRAAPGGRGGPVPVGDPRRAWVSILELLAATDAELLARHGRWYVAERNPVHLRRNALVVLGNVGDGTDPAVRAALRQALQHPDPLLRSHAVWASRRLGCDDLTSLVEHDPDPSVREELALAVVPRGTDRS